MDSPRAISCHCPPQLQHQLTPALLPLPCHRGVSGGERRRVTIGMELVIEPRLIVMDEPTSGLDSFTAANLLATCKQVAARGRIVLMSLHQPSPEMFEMLDATMLLAKGHLVYSGPPAAAAGYFAAAGMPIHRLRSVAEHMLMCVSEPRQLAALVECSRSDKAALAMAAAQQAMLRSSAQSASESGRLGGGAEPEDVRRAHSASTVGVHSLSDDDLRHSGQLQQRAVAHIVHGRKVATVPQHGRPVTITASFTALAGEPSTGSASDTTSASADLHPAVTGVDERRGVGYALRRVARTTGVLFWRAALDMARTPSLLMMHLLVGMGMGLLVGLVFYQQQYNTAGAQNRAGAMFFTLCLFGFMSLTVIDGLMLERALVLRETRGR
jgi:hypothetical protein